MSQYETILFDVDGTLLDFSKDQSIALERAFALIDVDYTKELKESYETINHALWRQMEVGEISQQEVLPKRFTNLFELYQIPRSGEEFQEIYSSQLQKTATLIDGAKEVLEKLKDNYELVVVTNSSKIEQKYRIRLAGLQSYFSHFFISQEIGYNKPDARFFEPVFDEIKTKDRSKILIVGDGLYSDIKGGKNVNIATCWYNPKNKLCPLDLTSDYEIQKLEELLHIL